VNQSALNISEIMRQSVPSITNHITKFLNIKGCFFRGGSVSRRILIGLICIFFVSEPFLIFTIVYSIDFYSLKKEAHYGLFFLK